MFSITRGLKAQTVLAIPPSALPIETIISNRVIFARNGGHRHGVFSQISLGVRHRRALAKAQPLELIPRHEPKIAHGQDTTEQSKAALRDQIKDLEWYVREVKKMICEKLN